jgi:hypothetical protein
MLFLSLLIVSSLTLATPHSVPYSSLSTCILSGEPCPTGSTCTPTQTCGGLCFTPQTLPPEIPCTIGNNGPCPTGSTCTPTMVCPTTAPCGGACINTNPFPVTNVSLPSITCVVGGPQCSSGSFCSQTEVCNGLCISRAFATTTTTPTPTPLRCGGNYGSHCPKKYKCVGKDGKHCGVDEYCHGFCVPK